MWIAPSTRTAPGNMPHTRESVQPFPSEMSSPAGVIEAVGTADVGHSAGIWRGNQGYQQTRYVASWQLPRLDSHQLADNCDCWETAYLGTPAGVSGPTRLCERTGVAVVLNVRLLQAIRTFRDPTYQKLKPIAKPIPLRHQNKIVASG